MPDVFYILYIRLHKRHAVCFYHHALHRRRIDQVQNIQLTKLVHKFSKIFHFSMNNILPLYWRKRATAAYDPLANILEQVDNKLANVDECGRLLKKKKKKTYIEAINY